MTRSTGAMCIALAGIILAIIGCSSGPSARPLGSSTASAALEVGAEWVPCHQMGMCVYSAELVGPDGGLSSAQFEILEAGIARIGPGLPAALRDGDYTLTLFSVMLGDTVGPNGAQTVLGEDARCATQFTVGVGALQVSVIGSFMPRLCTVSVAEGPNLRVAAEPERTTLAIEGIRSGCNSLGGCAYLARLAGPTGQSEADFIWELQGNRVTPAAGLPHFLDPGDYVLAFESRLMSDVIVPGQDRDFAVDAACRMAFAVGGSAEAIVVHLEFKTGVCLIELHMAAELPPDATVESILLEASTGTDVTGYRYGDVRQDIAPAVLEAYPRLTFKRDFAAMFVDQAWRKPTCRAADMVETGKLAAIEAAPFES